MAGFKLVVKGGVPQWYIDKHVDSELDYGIRMQEWLVAGDTLPADPAPTWTFSSNVVLMSSGVVNDPTFGPTAFVKISTHAAAPGSVEWAECTWRTSQGRIEVQRLNFNMVHT